MDHDYFENDDDLIFEEVWAYDLFNGNIQYPISSKNIKGSSAYATMFYS